MRHLATIREITTLRPIAGADRIEVAQVDGWECVVQKGEFHTGEHIVYIEVDSIVPERPEFEFCVTVSSVFAPLSFVVRLVRAWFSRCPFCRMALPPIWVPM